MSRQGSGSDPAEADVVLEDHYGSWTSCAEEPDAQQSFGVTRAMAWAAVPPFWTGL